MRLALTGPETRNHFLPTSRFDPPQTIRRGWDTTIPRDFIDRKRTSSSGETGYARETLRSIYAAREQMDRAERRGLEAGEAIDETGTPGAD